MIFMRVIISARWVGTKTETLDTRLDYELILEQLVILRQNMRVHAVYTYVLVLMYIGMYD